MNAFVGAFLNLNLLAVLVDGVNDFNFLILDIRKHHPHFLEIGWVEILLIRTHGAVEHRALKEAYIVKPDIVQNIHIAAARRLGLHAEIEVGRIP